jgi:hypothetical protein
VTREVLIRRAAANSFLDYCRTVYAGFEEPWHVRLLVDHFERIERGEITPVLPKIRTPVSRAGDQFQLARISVHPLH